MFYMYPDAYMHAVADLATLCGPGASKKASKSYGPYGPCPILVK